MDDLNARKLNLKDGGGNTPLLRNGYYKRPDGAILVHMMQTKAGVQKGLSTILAKKGLWVSGTKKQLALQVLFQKDYFYPEKLSLIVEKMVKSLGGWI